MNWPSRVKLADCSLKQNHQCRRFKSNSFHYIRDTNWANMHTITGLKVFTRNRSSSSVKHQVNITFLRITLAWRPTVVTSYFFPFVWDVMLQQRGGRLDPKTSQPDVLNLLSVKKYGGWTVKLSIISSLKDLMGWRSLKCSIIFFKCKLSIVWWEEGSQLFRWSSEVMSSLLERFSLLNPR